MTQNATLRWLVLVLLLAFGLRMVNLDGRTLWYDEAFAVLFAQTGLDGMLYGTLTPVAGGAADIHPLLYYMALNGWMQVFGQSTEMVRLLSVFAGLLSLAVLYRLAVELFDRQVGVTAAIIGALVPFHIQYAQEARMYMLLTLLLLLATWCYLRAWRGGRAAWWVAFGLFSGLAMYTQQLAAFYLVALGLTPLLARSWKMILPTGLGAGLALVVYLPWLVNLPGQVSKLQAYYWVPRPSLLRPLLTLRSFTVVALDLPGPWGMLAFFVGLVLVVFLFLQLAIRRRQMRSAERCALTWVLALSFGSLALMWLASQVLAPVYLDRALLAQGTVLYIALAWLLVRGRLPRLIAAVLAGLWLVAAGAGYVLHVTWHTFPNAPFDQADVYLHANWQQGDVIVHSNKLTALPMVYYNRDLPQTYMADRPGSGEDTLALPTQQALGLLGKSCTAAAAGRAERVWFVIFAAEEPQYLSLPGFDEHPHLGWLRAHYTEGDPVTFSDLLVIPFTGPDDYLPVCAEAAS